MNDFICEIDKDVTLVSSSKRKKKNTPKNKQGKFILTRKQLEIAACLIDGMSAIEISKKLSISLRTVEYYQQSIKRKLGCKNAYQTGYRIGIALMLLARQEEKDNLDL